MNEPQRATLMLIRDGDGAQQYLTAAGETVWLSGFTRNPNARPGDTGVLRYHSTPSYGLYFFEPDKGKS